MYIKLNLDVYKKICDITKTDYEVVGEFLTADSIISILEDLLYEIDAKNEQLEDIRIEVDEYYELKPQEREYGE